MDLSGWFLLWTTLVASCVVGFVLWHEWHDRQFARYWKLKARENDLAILWPVMKREAESLEHARKAMFMHMSMDPAYRDMTDVEFEEIKARLT